MTLVSIIIPTYNRADLLINRSLASVRAQTHQELDIIVVADGMTAKALHPIRAHLKEIADPRIRLINIKRPVYPTDPGTLWCVIGLDARNKGHDLAKGEWVGGLDDDDEFTLDHVEVLLAQAISSQSDFAYGRSAVHWPGGGNSEYGTWPPGHFQLCDGSAIWKRSLGYRYDWACVERGLPEDGDLWDRMVEGGVKFTLVNQIVHHYYPNER